MLVRHDLVAMLRVSRRLLAMRLNRVLPEHFAAVACDSEVTRQRKPTGPSYRSNRERERIHYLDDRGGFAVGTEIVQLKPVHSRGNQMLALCLSTYG